MAELCSLASTSGDKAARKMLELHCRRGGGQRTIELNKVSDDDANDWSPFPFCCLKDNSGGLMKVT